MFRKIIFWLHLGSGVITGLVVAMMSVTGVFLTYQTQVFAWSDHAYYRDSTAIEETLRPAETFIAAAQASDLNVTSLKYWNDPAAPVLASGGRGEGSLFIDAYTGEVLGEPSQAIRNLFSTVTRWHRWFNATGESRQTARLITGVSNLAFLFLILSGMYLWLPKLIRWPLLRERLTFSSRNNTTQQRDFNWHHVFGIWSAVPLVIVIATASVFSFSWANDLVYTIAGEDPPSRGSRSAPVSPAVSSNQSNSNPRRLPLDDLLTTAMAKNDDWKTITLTVPKRGDDEVSFRIDTGSGRQPQYQSTLNVDAATGQTLGYETLADRSPGRQARSWIRFLHTGEALGFFGQTIAGLVSLTSLFMV
ncbi:MAG: PepSY-associated TM helix domain-containing protein, partial [Woeseiaceae bacterium]